MRIRGPDRIGKFGIVVEAELNVGIRELMRRCTVTDPDSCIIEIWLLRQSRLQPALMSRQIEA
jgi:hypothetical protein